jgi:peptidoglycan/LPS O-acetylase OafA/YrhL
VCWSLAIEEQFYMLWPALVLLLSRRQLIAACVGAIVLAVAARLRLEHAGAGWIPIYVLTPCRLDGLAAGALAAVLVRGPGGVVRKLPAFKLAALAFAVLLAMLLAVQHGGWLWHAPGRLAAYTLLGGLFASLLPVVISLPGPSLAGLWLTSRPMRLLGRYSYAMYLFHVPCRDMAAMVINLQHFPTVLGSRLPGQMLFYALSLGLAIGVAWASWTLFESRILRLKRFFPVERDSAPRPVAGTDHRDAPADSLADAPEGEADLTPA